MAKGVQFLKIPLFDFFVLTLAYLDLITVLRFFNVTTIVCENKVPLGQEV